MISLAGAPGAADAGEICICWIINDLLNMGFGLKRKSRKVLHNFRKWFIPYLKFWFCGKECDDYKNTPVVINNFNRFSMLQKLIESLEKRGYYNIYIIDNASTYPPLLEWYRKCGYPVYMLNRNAGYLSIWETGIYKQFTDSFFAYTDSDLEICPECPDDFMEYFIGLLKRHPSYLKAGFSLKIDDLPERYRNRDKVIEWESQFWTRKVKGEENVYNAPIDTTFAVYRPFFKGEVVDFKFNYMRAGFPYSARHLPWYVDSSSLSEEERYYVEHIKTVTHWSALNLPPY